MCIYMYLSAYKYTPICQKVGAYATGPTTWEETAMLFRMVALMMIAWAPAYIACQNISP